MELSRPDFVQPDHLFDSGPPDGNTSHDGKRPKWDRVNFGRTLRKLRIQAGLTQVQMAKSIGRDRRRILVLEQATAVRAPLESEIALLWAVLGGEAAAEQLADTLGQGSPGIRTHRSTPAERACSSLAGEISRLLTQLDDVREGAKALARSAHHAFSGSEVPQPVATRATGAIEFALTELIDGLKFEASALRDTLERRHSSGGQPLPVSRILPDQVAEFRQRLLGHWSRCNGSVPVIDAVSGPDEIDPWLDALEVAKFHIDADVSMLASAALSFCSKLFLWWSKAALPVSGRRIDTPCAGEDVLESLAQDESQEELHLLLRRFAELPFPSFAKACIPDLWPPSTDDDLLQAVRLWAQQQRWQSRKSRRSRPDPKLRHQSLQSAKVEDAES